MKKLAIICTHPIQYNAPLFKLLSLRKNVQVKVFYTWGQAKDKVFDRGFGIERAWDIPLLEGYEYMFVENTAANPGSHHFNGIINPLLIKYIEAYNPDAILVFGWSFNSHFKVLRYFHGKVPILFRGDSTLLDKRTFVKSILRKLFLKWLYQHVDFALYVGSQNKLYYLQHGLKQEQLVFAPHAVDNNRFAEPALQYKQKATEWKQKLGITNELIILYAGKFENVKNPFIFIRLASELINLPVKFILVGNGPLEKIIKQKTKGNDKFIFLDFQNQAYMPVVYRLGDIFVLPSKSETWGLSVNEALACGIPVLVSDKCGCAIDLVKDGINGYIFKSNDTDDLIRKIGLLADNKKSLSAMSKHSFRLIQQWSFEKICEQVENLVA